MRIKNITFKEYTQAQPLILPPDLEELIPEGHLVRVVNKIIDGIEMDSFLENYKGEGTSSIHTAAKRILLIWKGTGKEIISNTMLFTKTPIQLTNQKSNKPPNFVRRTSPIMPKQIPSPAQQEKY